MILYFLHFIRAGQAQTILFELIPSYFIYPISPRNTRQEQPFISRMAAISSPQRGRPRQGACS
jgi:hypothetical protein